MFDYPQNSMVVIRGFQQISRNQKITKEIKVFVCWPKLDKKCQNNLEKKQDIVEKLNLF